MATNNEQQNKDTSSEKKSVNNDNEKWLYGIAGFGLGCLTTYLVMDYQHQKEKRMYESKAKEANESRNENSKQKVKITL